MTFVDLVYKKKSKFDNFQSVMTLKFETDENNIISYVKSK